MAGQVDPLYLNEIEVDYELRIRKCRGTRKNLTSKRLILTSLLEKDKDRDISELVDPDFDVQGEQEIINKTLDDLQSLVTDFAKNKNESLSKLIQSRLISLTNRVNRFKITLEPKEDHDKQTEFQEYSSASCLEIQAILESHLKNIKSTSTKSELNNQTKFVPVYKWGVTFDGSTSVRAFLERVIELSRARNVSEEVLFESSIDLFSGQALIWYRSIKHRVSTWSELSIELENAFLSPNYDEELLDEIKMRTQGRLEPVSIFSAAMLNLFNRLTTKLTDREQLRIIRRNLLPKYVERLALVEISSTADLISLCRKIDEASQFKSKYSSPKSSNCLESDLAYVENNVSTRTGAGPSTKNKSDKCTTASTSKIDNVSNNIKPTICWNCRKNGHTFNQCKKRRNKFCFKCGKQNHTVRTCGCTVSKN